MAAHFSVLAWRIPWTEGPGGPQSMGLRRVGHDYTTNTHTLHSCCCVYLSASEQVTQDMYEFFCTPCFFPLQYILEITPIHS